MFRPGETICVSNNEFGYHSVPLEKAMDGLVTLLPTEDSAKKRKMTQEEATERVDSRQLIMCALNPIEGFREDANCTSYRNFLVEMDYGPLPEQLAYAKKIGLPYSAVVFSGNKSLHFLISLDRDLPSEAVYRTFSEWILAVANMADDKTKNPSRSIRIPGAYREPKKKQRLVELRGATKLDDLVSWLARYPDCKPKKHEKKQISENVDFSRVKPWVKKRLTSGLDPKKGRNQQWFSIACEFALAGYSEDDTLELLAGYFVPDRDFKEKEWKTSVLSGFKHAYKVIK